jgi:predicted dithiol-disulfide oxidoreductase (DUF899 family)
MATTAPEIKQHQVVSHNEWVEARKAFLTKEKEFTHLRDELSRQRRELPWEKVDKPYKFEGAKGASSLGDLFGKRSQLAVYHFMLGPGWTEGCPSCSYISDHFDGMAIHLANRDVNLVAVSHAPYAEIAAFKQRMGWHFNWYSSFNTDFNYDFNVSATTEEKNQKEVYYNYEMAHFPADERPGFSAFIKGEDGAIYHSYSAYARGLDILVGAYNWLDYMPKGRDEEGLKHSMAWVRHHDKYTDGYVVDANQGYVQPEVVRIKIAGSSCCSGEHHE